MGKLAPLSRDQRRTLARLSSFLRERNLYLAGGVAVAVHRQHRRSLDLDFFSRRAPLDLAAARDALVQEGIALQVVALTDASLRLKIDETPVDIVSYPYELLTRPILGPEGVQVANVRDLATMKLSAVAQRGIYRDFWDLHELLKGGLTLERALADYANRYDAARTDIYHLLRSLTYFDDAERSSTFPVGLTPRHWQEIRDWFEERTAATLRKLTAKSGGAKKRKVRDGGIRKKRRPA